MKGVTPKIRMLCFVLINSIPLSLWGFYVFSSFFVCFLFLCLFVFVKKEKYKKYFSFFFFLAPDPLPTQLSQPLLVRAHAPSSGSEPEPLQAEPVRLLLPRGLRHPEGDGGAEPGPPADGATSAALKVPPALLHRRHAQVRQHGPVREGHVPP